MYQCVEEALLDLDIGPAHLVALDFKHHRRAQSVVELLGGLDHDGRVAIVLLVLHEAVLLAVVHVQAQFLDHLLHEALRAHDDDLVLHVGAHAAHDARDVEAARCLLGRRAAVVVAHKHRGTYEKDRGSDVQVEECDAEAGRKREHKKPPVAQQLAQELARIET